LHRGYDRQHFSPQLGIAIEPRDGVSAGSLLSQNGASELDPPSPSIRRLPRLFVSSSLAGTENDTYAEIKWFTAYGSQIAERTVLSYALANRNRRKLFSVCSQRFVFQSERNDTAE
jgi:hypothetical protein